MLTLTEDNCEVGVEGAMLLGWVDWGAERSDGCWAFPLVLLSCPQKVMNDNCEWGCKGKLSQRS